MVFNGFLRSFASSWRSGKAPRDVWRRWSRRKARSSATLEPLSTGQVRPRIPLLQVWLSISFDFIRFLFDFCSKIVWKSGSKAQARRVFAEASVRRRRRRLHWKAGRRTCMKGPTSGSESWQEPRTPRFFGSAEELEAVLEDGKSRSRGSDDSKRSSRGVGRQDGRRQQLLGRPTPLSLVLLGPKRR